MGGHASKLQEFQRDRGIKIWLVDLCAAAFRGNAPALAEASEELVHQAGTLARNLQQARTRSRKKQTFR